MGEFSFILGTVALGLSVINDAGWNALVAASIISIALNPYLYGRARRLASSMTTKTVKVTHDQSQAINPNRCILVGYGPVGKIVHDLLLDRGLEITVIDLNLETVRRLRAEGHNALYGDALRPGTLEDAGITTAGSFILSTDIEDAPEIIKHARLLNPDLQIMARCVHLRDAAALRRAGATVVVAGEAEVGVALSEVVTADDQMACVTAAEHREKIRNILYDIVSHSEKDHREIK